MAEVFTVTLWSRSIGDSYTLACILRLTQVDCTIWVEDHAGELERQVCDTLTEALRQAEERF